MKKLFLTGTIVLLTATSALAQSGCRDCLGDGFPNAGRAPAPPPMHPKDLACYRANYAPTLAMQRCADQAIARRIANDRGKTRR
jgi:hypothetical protein